MGWGEVLIVDDSSTSRMIIQRCMEMAGVEASGFCYAENGIDGIAAAKERGGIGLVITDINMPKMDGRTFARLLKSDPATRNLPLVIVSSIADASLEAELLGLGAIAIVKKPVSPAKLLEALGGKA